MTATPRRGPAPKERILYETRKAAFWSVRRDDIAPGFRQLVIVPKDRR